MAWELVGNFRGPQGAPGETPPGGGGTDVRRVTRYFDRATWSWPARGDTTADQFIRWDASKAIHTDARPVPRPTLNEDDEYVPPMTDPLRYAVTNPTGINYWQGVFQWLNQQVYPSLSIPFYSIPTASFTTSMSEKTVTVDATASNGDGAGIVSYDWSWGDGQRTIVEDGTPVTSHTYADEGDYTISLIIKNTFGSEDMETKVVTVDIILPAPSAVANLRVTAVTKDSYTIAWEPAVGEGITEYRIREAVRPEGSTTTWGNDIYVTQRQAGANTGTFTYTRTGRLPDTEYLPSVEARNADRYGPRTKIETRTATNAPIIPFTELGSLSANFSRTSATLAADTTDPTKTRVQSVNDGDGNFTLVLNHPTESSQPFLNKEGDIEFMTFDGSNDRLYNATSTTLYRARTIITTGVRFRAPNDKTLNTGSRFIHHATSSRVGLGLMDGRARVGGQRGRTGDVSEWFEGTTDLRDGLWHTIVATHDYAANWLTFLVDGVVAYDGPFQATTNAGLSTNDSNHSVVIGSTTGPAEYFRGDVRQLVVYRTGMRDIPTLKEMHRTLMEGTVIPPSTAPAAPTSVIGTTGDSGQAIIDWSDVTNAVEYRVIRTDTTAVVAVVTAPTSTATITGLTNGTPYTFAVRAVNSAGEVSGNSNSVTVTPTDTPPLGVSLEDYIYYSRNAYYPDGVGEWAHLPHYSEWKVIYWVPSNSQFRSPNGEMVIRGAGKISGTSTSIASYTNFTGSNGASGVGCAIVICPEKFIDMNYNGKWMEVDLWRGVIMVGWHYQNTKFMGNPYGDGTYPTQFKPGLTPPPTTKTDTVMPGHWQYNIPAEHGLGTGDAATIDNLPGRGRMHERSIYIRPGSGYATEKTFYALEGTYLEGDWVVEGLNVNGINTGGRVVITNYRHDRASVYWRTSADGTRGGKYPGGDSIQVFGNVEDLMIVGCSSITHYQALFMQHGGRKKIHIINWNSRVPTGDLTPYGGESGYQLDFSGPRRADVEYKLENVTWWRGRSTGIENQGDYPEVASALVTDHVPATAKIGIKYAADFVPFNGVYVPPETPTNARTGRATPTTVGPTSPESELAVLNGNQTITVDGTILEGKLINGYVTIKANNVTIRNCIVRAPVYTGTTSQIGIKCWDINTVTNTPWTGLVVEDTLIEVPVANRNVYQGGGLAAGNATLRNVEIRGWVDGIGVYGSSSTSTRRYLDADRVYIHDLPFYEYDPAQTDGSHNDGIQDQGRSRVTITRSRILGGRTAGILIQQNIANVTGQTNHESVTIEDNFLDLEYDGGSVLNITETGKGVITNLTVKGNTFGRSFPTKPRILVTQTTRDASTTVISENRYEDGTLVPVSLGG